MERGISDTNILKQFCESFCDIVEKHTPYIIVSGYLVIASGRYRATEDIDMILPRLPLPQFITLHTDLVSHDFECIQSSDPCEIYDDYLNQNISIRYVKKGSFVPEMEIKFAKDALDEYQLTTRQKIPLTGLNVWFSSININIAFKEELLKSDKDIEDAKYLRITYASRVAEKEITNVKSIIKRLRLS